MSNESQPEPISKKVVLYQIPGMENVTVTRDVEYGIADDGPLTMDLYYPPGALRGARLPALILVAGYPDLGVQKVLNCKFKEMGSSVSLCRLAAASGLVGIAYSNREPTADVHKLLRHLQDNAASLGIDANRLGVWASSGNVPLALSVLMQESADHLKCAVLCYGFMLDLDGHTSVAHAATQWRFVNPCAGRTVDDLPRDLPMLIVRAGQDEFAGLNATIDRFLASALSRNLPVAFVNHPEAPHAFDLMHDSEATRRTIRLMLEFLRIHLLD